MRMQQRLCQICKSSNITLHEEDGVTYLRCKQCGFDEAGDFDEAYPEGKATGGKGSPYKRGGSQRTVKR